VGWLDLVAIACGLAMDAFAVALVTGLTLEVLTRRRVFRLAFHFGLFQALMPAIGWAAGSAVHRFLGAFDHWIACGLLVAVGGHMIVGALERRGGPPPATKDPTSGWRLVVLSVATSIDALAVGLTLAMLGSAILLPALVIGVVTAAFTSVGMLLGRRVGAAWGRGVEVAGGLILIAIGIRIVTGHVIG